MESSLENLNQAAIKRGLYIALISIVLTVVMYYVAPQMLTATSFGFAIMAVMLIIYIFFTIDLRKEIGGFWTFRQALKGIFLMAVVAGLVSAVFNLIFFKFIEPGAYDKLSGFASENLTKTLEAFGTPEDQIDAQVEAGLERIKSQYNPTVSSFFMQLGIAIIIEFVMSLIFAAIFKKERPVFAPVEE